MIVAMAPLNATLGETVTVAARVQSAPSPTPSSPTLEHDRPSNGWREGWPSRRLDCAYFHSQSLLFVFPSASASYSKTTATAFRRLSFWESL